MINLRRLTLALLAMLLVFSVGCSGGADKAKSDLSVYDILSQSSLKIKEVDNLHFKLDSQGGSTPIGFGLAMDSAEGDISKPDKMKALVKASVLGQAIEVSFVVLGTDTYMTNPLSGKWEAMASGMNPIAFFDPNTGAVNVLDNMKDAQKLGDDKVDGVKTYHVKGMVPTSALTSIVGDQVQQGDVKTEVWIGMSDLLPRQFRLDGQIMKDEKPNITRLLRFSNLGQPVTIEAPK